LNIAGLVFSFVVSFGLLILAMSVHEFAHGWAAYMLGDRTAKYAGRLTLNPFSHIDPTWTVLIPLLLFISSNGRFVFGAAKPVPINYWMLRNPKRDILLIGASGPLANFIFAFLLTILVKILPLPARMGFLVINLIVINVLLGVFNLLPIPPLDGSRILAGLLPNALSSQYLRLEPYGFIILALLIWAGVFSSIVSPVVNFIMHLMGSVF
jgi:Zn-dependent protease